MGVIETALPRLELSLIVLRDLLGEGPRLGTVAQGCDHIGQIGESPRAAGVGIDAGYLPDRRPALLDDLLRIGWREALGQVCQPLRSLQRSQLILLRILSADTLIGLRGPRSRILQQPLHGWVLQRARDHIRRLAGQGVLQLLHTLRRITAIGRRGSHCFDNLVHRTLHLRVGAGALVRSRFGAWRGRRRRRRR